MERRKASASSALISDVQVLQQRFESAPQKVRAKQGIFSRLRTSLLYRAETYVELHRKPTGPATVFTRTSPISGRHSFPVI
jgi:hypothetical protein